MNVNPTQDSVSLDVRPVLARGEEPFDMIMGAAARVAPGGTLELTAPFEPLPLYSVLSRRGFSHVSSPPRDGTFQVRFMNTGIVPSLTVGEVHERYAETGAVFAEYGIDLCCGGNKTLDFAAKAHHLDLPSLLARLQQATIARG